MEQKIKVGDLVDSINAFHFVMSLPLTDYNLFFVLKRIGKEINPIIEDWNDAYTQVYKDLGELNKESGEYVVPPTKMQLLNKALKDLKNEEIIIHTKKYNLLAFKTKTTKEGECAEGFNAAIVSALDWLIKEPEIDVMKDVISKPDVD